MQYPQAQPADIMANDAAFSWFPLAKEYNVIATAVAAPAAQVLLSKRKSPGVVFILQNNLCRQIDLKNSFYVIESSICKANAMIEIFTRKVKDSELRIIEKTEPGCWMNVIAPTEDEIAKISSDYKLPVDIFHDMLDLNEMPVLNVEDGFTYMIMRIPHKDGQNLITIPLGVIIKEDIIITIAPFKNDIVDYFIGNRAKDFFTTMKTRFILQIFSRSNHQYMKYLNEIYKQIKQKESAINKLSEYDIVNFVESEKTLLYFNTSTSSNANILEKIMAGKVMQVFKEDQDILEDLIMDNKQTMEMTKMYSMIIVNIRNAYSSILTNNLNKILKFLAAVTVVMTVPMIIASLYGMNVTLPNQSDSFAFFYVITGILVASMFMVIAFNRKGWI